MVKDAGASETTLRKLGPEDAGVVLFKERHAGTAAPID
jgi:hypothetical protein